MNSPSDHPPPSLPERVTRVEVTCDHILEELRELRTDFRELRNEMRELRNEMRGELRDMRRAATTDFRILFGALIAVSVGLAGTMARAFGWI
jgi:predicted phage-related endonuclease